MDVTHGVGQDSSQVSEEALVDSEDTLCADSFQQAVKNALVEVAGLVVHAGHDSIWRNQISHAKPVLIAFRKTYLEDA